MGVQLPLSPPQTLIKGLLMGLFKFKQHKRNPIVVDNNLIKGLKLLQYGQSKNIPFRTDDVLYLGKPNTCGTRRRCSRT